MTKKKFNVKKLKRKLDWESKSYIIRIKKDVKREKVTTGYVERNRYIPQDIYERLKRKKLCDFCHKPLVHLPQIHHKIAIMDGGNNDESNLMAVHKECHVILDEQQRERRERKEVIVEMIKE